MSNSISNKVNWLAAKRYYIENRNMNLNDIAKKYNTSERSVERHAVAETWVKRRSDVGEMAELAMVENIADRISKSVAQDERIFGNARNYISARLNRDIRRFERIELEDPYALTSDRAADLLTPRQLNDLMEALQKSVAGRRTALGLTVTITKKESDFNERDPFANFSAQQIYDIVKQDELALRLHYAEKADIAVDPDTGLPIEKSLH